ncbi:transporter [Aquiflexum lacus]|uniref:transporter n=1 Tax=Aquiflexum lacus TaxID=2483805 RepID=UPI00189317B3|nr:transporter [Aquiflexum lacus]
MKKSILLISISMLSFLAIAQEESSGTSAADELAKKLQNPVASLISVPFQNNFDFGIGPSNGSRYTLNFQPVIPMSISEDWNLIARVIVPVISQNNVFGESGSQSGLSDIVLSGFFSPKEPTSGGLIWGVGPAILVPTATNNLLGTQKFGLGPTAVALKQSGMTSFGVLINHIWSVAGNADRANVNSTFFEPFIAQNFPGGKAISLNTELTQNWEAGLASGSVNLVGSKVLMFGKQATQLAIGPRLHYGKGNTASWGIRAAFVLLFPK